jgi:hypothetical protein
MRRSCTILLFGVAAVALDRRPAASVDVRRGDAPPSATASARQGAARDSALWIEMRNVDLHVDARSAMHIRSLRGQVIPTTRGTTPWLDRPSSFRVRATSGVVALDGDAVSALLNEVAFAYPGAPIRNLRITIENGSVVQRGTLHKGVPIPFQMWSVPKLQPDGRLRLHPDRLKIFGVNGTTLMRALGLHLQKMMDVRKARGVTVQGDDIYLDPLQITPSPMVEGKLTAVRIEGALLVQEFARTPDDTIFGTLVTPDSGSRNFVYFRGGTLRFGKLTMTDTDLLIHDADERDPFDLYFAEYNRQLVAGHTRNLENLGLRTWMVDYGKLAPPTRARAAASGIGRSPSAASSASGR